MQLTIANHPTSGEPLELKQFDSASEMAEFGDAAKLAKAVGMGRWIGRRFESVDALRQAASDVWHDGMEMFDAARAKLADHSLPAPATRRRRARFDEFGGDEVCLDRLRAGAPFWRTTTRASVTGPTALTIAVETCAPANRDADSMVWRGIAAVALTELLESAGYRVELVAYDYGRKAYVDGHGCLAATTLKAASEPLDVAGLVSATSGWYFRTFGLAAIVRGIRGVPADDGCGFAAALSPAELAELLGRPVAATIDGVWSEAEAVDLVESVLRRIAAGELASA